MAFVVTLSAWHSTLMSITSSRVGRRLPDEKLYNVFSGIFVFSAIVFQLFPLRSRAALNNSSHGCAGSRKDAKGHEVSLRPVGGPFNALTGHRLLAEYVR